MDGSCMGGRFEVRDGQAISSLVSSIIMQTNGTINYHSTGSAALCTVAELARTQVSCMSKVANSNERIRPQSTIDFLCLSRQRLMRAKKTPKM